MGGQIQYTFDAPSVTLNLINSGKIKAIAVAATERLPNAGNIPTFAEAGLPALFHSGRFAYLGMNAVVRNRIKRLVREFFRREKGRIPQAQDIVVIAKRGAEKLSLSEVSGELRTALNQGRSRQR